MSARITRTHYGLLVTETLQERPGLEIEASAMKRSNGKVSLRLQEQTVEHHATGFTSKSFMMFKSWGPMVAEEPIQRVTEKALMAFYERHRPAAVALAAERAATWSEPQPEEV